jgi:hypothetical protein
VAFTYKVVALARAGRERHRHYTSEDSLSPGDVIRLYGRDWLIERIEPNGDEVLGRAFAKPARYRVHLQHPDGREELGAFRRFRPDAPRLGHAFSTIEDGQPASWQVVDERLAYDDQGEPYLELLAERDFDELEQLPDHELEHALAARGQALPAGATAAFGRAEAGGLSIELVALEPGEDPEWNAAESFIDSLVLEEIEDDLFELCGVDTDRDPRESWLPKVKERLRSDLERFRGDIEGDLDEIEEWDFRDGRIFASVGNADDEADPDSGHGWMCRLVDAGVLRAAGFERVRKSELWGSVA